MPDNQVTINPPAATGIDVYALLLQAHTASIQNTTELRAHQQECSNRDARNERIFGDTRQTIVKLFERIEETKKALETNIEHVSDNVEKVSDDVNKSNRWIYMIVGGITLAGVVFNKLPMHGVFGN